MSRLVPFFGFLLLVALFGFGIWWNTQHDQREVPSPLIDKPAPAFALTRLDDASQTIRRDDMLGKVWLLNVWASWCEACREEQPALLAFSRSVSGSRAVPMIGLNYKDTRPQGTGWLAQFGNPFEASLFDDTGKVGIDFGVYGVPETFVIDKRGVIRFKLVGPLTVEAIETRIRPLLKELDG
jgi:cytochrome c biogenesis protein CcmG/thiol:disulfide interchange protein DsbE